MKVIDVGQYVDANDVIDLGAQVFDAQFYQALGRQTMKRRMLRPISSSAGDASIP